jgi:hypothetical protein
MSALKKVVVGAAAAGTAAYAGWVGAAWRRYGRVEDKRAGDPLLERFVPRYEVRERHERYVKAPASITFVCAKEASLRQSPIARTIFALRSLPARLGGPSREEVAERGILEETLSLGWGILAEEPGREIVVGAVTQPWKADVVFRALPPENFATFSEPGYVKIAWTLAVNPIGASSCVFRTETRAIATDPASRSRFRRYWALLSPGIVLIRHAMLRVVATEAERRHREERIALEVRPA